MSHLCPCAGAEQLLQRGGGTLLSSAHCEWTLADPRVEHCGAAQLMVTADPGCFSPIDTDLGEAGVTAVAIPRTGEAVRRMSTPRT